MMIDDHQTHLSNVATYLTKGNSSCRSLIFEVINFLTIEVAHVDTLRPVALPEVVFVRME